MQLKTIKGFSEESIIDGCRKGDRKSQYILYESYSRKMMGICMRYVNDVMDAEDIVQNGFVKVFNNIEKFRGEGSFEGWMRRIFVNCAIEHYRRNVNMYPVLDIEYHEPDAMDESAVSHLNSEDLLNLIQKLSPGYKTVFNLYAIEGYSHKEIGTMLGISEGTSKSQLARARVILQKMVEQSAQILVGEYKNEII